MPEGDTIHYAANRIRPVLQGHVPDALATPHAVLEQPTIAGIGNRPTYWCPRCQS